MSKDSHSFNPSVASEVGVICAIMAQHFLFIQKNFVKKDEFVHQVWIKRSISALREVYPYLTDREIRGALDRLERSDYIVSKTQNERPEDRTKSYQLTRRGWELMDENPFDKKANGVLQKGESGFDKKENDDLTKGKMLIGSYKDVVNNIIEGNGDKKTPPPATYDEMIERVERLSVEAKKEKAPQVAPPPLTIHSGFNEVMDYLEFVDPCIFKDDPTHIVHGVDCQTLPGSMIRTAEILEPTNANQITIKTGMNSAGETYIFEHTERVTIPNGTGYPLAQNAMEAQKIIENWCAVNGEQVRWSYDAARRKFTPEDLHERLIDFCGHYANTAEKQILFFLDPARMFQNGLTKWLQTQNKFDREQAAKQPKTAKKQGTPNAFGGDQSKYQEVQKF